MLKINRHIAFLLLGIFFFPIVFQSIHILRHHFHSHEEHVQECFIKTLDTVAQYNADSHNEYDEYCPICDYHFSINDVPEIFCNRLIIPVGAYVYNESIIVTYFNQIWGVLSSRAPPVFFA